MYLKDELIGSINQFNPTKLAKKILDLSLEKELIRYCLSNDVLLSSRSMWVLGHCSEINFDRIIPFHEVLITNLKNETLHNGVIRNTLRLFQKYPVPVKHESFLLDKCLDYIKNPSQAIAVRAYSMTVVLNIAKKYPELLDELRLTLINLEFVSESPGIKSKIKNTLKTIEKIKIK